MSQLLPNRGRNITRSPFVMQVLLLVLALWGLTLVRADTPANCTFEDVVGTWTFTESERNFDSSVVCDSVLEVIYTKEFTFSYPNVVTDELGNSGTWTLIYNQGFEVNINERSYFAFFLYEGDFSSSISFCGRTFTGWSRDKTVRNWACYDSQKSTLVPPRYNSLTLPSSTQKYRVNKNFIDKINSVQSSWTAKAYPENEKYTLLEMFRRAGGAGSMVMNPPSPAPATQEQKDRAALLPETFDWRDVDGVDYVSPVRDQLSCGSCYAFASLASLESRIRIATRNARQDIFSPQDVNDCSLLSQGCAGGFNYLIAGRYAQDQGVVAEDENPYMGFDYICSRSAYSELTYVSEYEYVGGYYGACNEELMMEALVTGGPYPVSYMVYDDFYAYEGGVYSHTELKDSFNPFVITNHAVLLVGYGVDETSSEKYWLLKNSWGESFGESGYFRILRGTNECGIESAGFLPTPIP